MVQSYGVVLIGCECSFAPKYSFRLNTKFQLENMSSLISIYSRGFRRYLLKWGTQTVKQSDVKITRRLSTRVTSNCDALENIFSVKQKSISAFHWAQKSQIHLSNSFSQTEVIKVPQFADSVSEGDVKFTVKVGDFVKVDQVVMEIETDKTTVGVPAPFSGVIEAILVSDGATVKANQELFKLKKAEGGPAASPAPIPKAAAPAAGPPKPAPSVAAPKPKPAAPAPSAPPPTPPPKPAAPAAKIPVAAMRPAQGIAQPTVKVPPADYSREITGTRTEQRVKMNRMRLKIAERLKQAQNTNAMLTTFNEIDMSSAMAFRKGHLEAFQKKYGIKIGFMSIFTKASAYALQDQPVVNAVIDGGEIVYRDFIDISVAVATPKGLVVPVIRNVEGMNFADIEIAMAALGDKAKKGKIAVEDMDGGTFTISNGGVFGSLMGTPIINPPQSAILGMHGIFERPIAIKGQVVIRPMMYVALTYDHRLVDGREAVLFLRKIKDAVEDPRIMLAGL